MISTELSPSLHEEFINETEKRRVSRPWTRVTLPIRVSGPEALADIEAYFGAPPPTVHDCDSGYVSETPSEAWSERLLTLHGDTMDGARVNLTRHKYGMSVYDIFQFLASRLRTTEEFDTARRAFGQVPVRETAKTSLKPLETMAVVGQHNHEPRPQNKSSPKGKGGGSERKPNPH